MRLLTAHCAVERSLICNSTSAKDQAVSLGLQMVRGFEDRRIFESMGTRAGSDEAFSSSMRTNLLEYSWPELQACLQDMGEPPFRARQLWQWAWQKGCSDFSEMTNLGRDLRSQLTERFSLDRPTVKDCSRSRDGTVKFLLRLTDGCIIETVLIPEKDHTTLCISSQVGCPLGCTFCSTGRMGFQRNLTPSEILGQVLVARDHLQSTGSPLPLRNIVFMGMGEPLLNWSQVRHSLEIIRDPLGLNVSHRRVTVSTVGVPETLETCARSGLASLAVSLHAPDQSLRAELMPKAARLMTISDLMSVLQSIPLKPRQRITIEYILIKSVNDSVQQAKDLHRLLSGLKCKINLIAFNPGGGIDFQAPAMEDILRFEQVLWDKGQTVILRKSKGQDIHAACGQLIDKQFSPASGPAEQDHQRTTS